MNTGLEKEQEGTNQIHMESLRGTAMVVYTFELVTWRHVQKDQRVEVSYIGKPCLKQASKQTKHVSVITASKSLHMKTKPRCLQLHQFSASVGSSG